MIIHNAYMHAWRYPCTLHKTMKSGLIINPHQQISLSANIGTVGVSKLFFNNTIGKSEEVVFSFSWCPLKESSSGGECLDLDHHCTDGFRFKGWKTNIDFSNEVLCQISMLQRIGHSFVRNDLKFTGNSSYPWCRLVFWRCWLTSCRRWDFDKARAGTRALPLRCSSVGGSPSPTDHTQGLVTNSIIFSWLFTINYLYKQVRFQQMHNQGDSWQCPGTFAPSATRLTHFSKCPSDFKPNGTQKHHFLAQFL